MKTNHIKILIAVGLLIMSISQIIAHYVKLSDFILGSIAGCGIGLLLLSFLKTKKTSAH